jgi:hypothetical protein
MISAIQHEDRELQTQLERFPEALRAAVERGLARGTELLRAAVTSFAQSPLGVPSGNAFGEFAGSVTSTVTDENGQPVGRVFLAPPADRYGLFVEVGTRPHFPPPAALEGWVRRRLGITNDREVREVAFLIGRRIARVGTPGHFFFERALEQNKANVVRILEEEVEKAVTSDE